MRDLNPAGGATLPPLPGGWLTRVAVVPVAVVLGVVAAGEVAGASVLPAVALGAAQALPLMLAPVRPVAAFWVSILVGVLVSETVRDGGPGSVWAEPSLLAHLGVLAVAGLRVRGRVLPVLWLVTLLAGAVLVQRMPGMNASPDLMEMTTLSAVVLVAAGALRGRREALRRLADQQRISQVLEERARIARELHDVVAHHMSLIAIQAEAAPYRVADAPPELVRSFATIRSSAVEAMTELRRVLGLLRDPAEAHGAAEAPQPGLADLSALVAAVRATGVEVGLSVTGEARHLDPGVELSGYRIVQEALSNALRHAPGASVRVDVGYGGAALTVGVVNGPPAKDSTLPGGPMEGGPVKGGPATSSLAKGRAGEAGPPGRGGAGGGGGHGLVGMRERVAMLGGELSVGPLADGGYAVTAVLPVGVGV